MSDCVFPTALRLLDADTLVSFLEIQDTANGLSLIDDIEPPDETARQGVRKSARVRGEYPTTDPIDDAGAYLCTLLVKGSTWAEMTTRWQAVRSGLRTTSPFILEEVLSGVQTRWYCNTRPAIIPALIDVGSRINNEREFDLRIATQPNPSVTIV